MSQKRLVGLNSYRAIAIFMMMAAHSIRIQENFAHIVNNRSHVSIFDHFLLLFIDIEPIISALFLFIAGFSLTLSVRAIQSPQQKKAWFKKLIKKAGALYGIAVVFFIAENGFQWPDMLVSAGVLGIIAVSILISAWLLLYGGKEKGLIIATALCLFTTYFLEVENLNITGLNAGAGGFLPLVVMGFIGTLFGLGYQRFNDTGLFAGLFIAAIISVFCFSSHYPNVFVYKSHFNFYASDPIAQISQSFLALFNSDIQPTQRIAGFWNHSSIYPLRFTVAIIFFLILSIKLITRATNPVVKLLNGLGSYGLTIYIYHLMVLALLDTTGLKPQTGWQTLLLILLLIVSGYALIHNRLSLDPDTPAPTS